MEADHSHGVVWQGMRVRPDGPQLISELIRKSVGADCSVLMGANIAQDIGAGQLSEATIGYAPHPSSAAQPNLAAVESA